MKNVDDLIANAGELAGRGLSRGEIADELNVSRETASWLVERSDAGRAAPTEPAPETSPDGPDDIHVDWSTIGRDSARLGHVAGAMADLLSKQGEAVDLSVGIEKAGVPLATAVARALDTDLAAYAPAKHQWEEGDMADLGGSFSRNFAAIRGRDCYIVDHHLGDNDARDGRGCPCGRWEPSRVLCRRRQAGRRQYRRCTGLLAHYRRSCR